MLSLSLCRCFAGVVPAKRSPKLVVSTVISNTFVCACVFLLFSTEWKECYLKNKRQTYDSELPLYSSVSKASKIQCIHTLQNVKCLIQVKQSYCFTSFPLCHFDSSWMFLSVFFFCLDFSCLSFVIFFFIYILSLYLCMPPLLPCCHPVTD